MRLPRDISGNELAMKLEKYGYRITRQTGSHLRITTIENGEHHITIPAHKDFRVGLLSSVLTDIADHLKITKDELVESLFGK